MKKGKVTSTLFENKTTVMFVILCLVGIIAANKPLSFVLNELVSRIGRNTFLVLSLLIPIQAGMGLNFAVVIGAMAAQIAVFFVVHMGLGGISGLLLCALISMPLAIFFGFLTGKLFNGMKGSEMIGGTILKFFADGLYQFFFLFIIGGVIPLIDPVLMISSGVGVKNTIDLSGNLRYALDDLWRMTLLDACTIIAIVVIVYAGIKLIKTIKFDLKKVKNLDKAAKIKKEAIKKCIITVAISVVGLALTYIPYITNLLFGAKIPVITYLCIVVAYVLNIQFTKSVLGQNIRTVGQDMKVADSSGLNVNNLRIIAMVLSTLLASWGHLITLQNMGTLQTYNAHFSIGEYAIAALLVGGASVTKASPKNAVLGVILFHTLFIVSPDAGKNLFNNAQIGEYFRVFVSFGVIAIALVLHAWESKKKKNKADEATALAVESSRE